ncbi:ATP-binding protein [Polaribacter sp. Hel_I_88]|uniref:ATP-binding protein n=1 Tax=Polaribacter sp. Hel_I_88 TaxID=1250006 RepID=UPI0004789F41|nr:ATP-binding protein [Polaribacter sp. Hel_I_88]
MKEIISLQQHTIAALFNETLLPVFFNKIKAHHKVILEINELQNKLIAHNFKKDDKNLVFRKLNEYKTELEKIVSSYFSTLNLGDELLFDAYFRELNTHLETLDETIKRVQDKERFLKLDGDSKLLKFRKGVKKSLFTVSKLPLKTANVFRKTKKEIVYWQQEIPFKNVTEYYFKSELIHNLNEVIEAIYKEISEITDNYWSIDKKIDEKIELYLENNTVLDFSEELSTNVQTIPSLEARIENHKKTFQEIFEANILNYTNALYKADTIELSANFFRAQNIAKYQKDVLEKSHKNALLWQNTFSVFESDWELDIEIFTIIFHVMFTYDKLGKSIEKRSELIGQELTVLKNYITNVKSTIANSDTKTALKAAIISELKNLSKDFNTLIEETTIRITNQEIPLQINDFEENALNVLKTLSTKRAISSDNDYTTKTVASSINYISPYELVSYQSWPSLAAKIKQVKLDLNLKVTTFVDDINALSQVCEFNLESALSLFESETKENTSKENTPKKVALEGLERSEEKIEDLKNTLVNLNTANGELLLPSIAKFNKSILELTDTENITEIRLTIAKAKSIEKSKLLKEKVLNNVKNFVPVAMLYGKTKYKKTVASVKSMLLRNGWYKEPVGVTSDLSEFLKQAERALDELPYVYQRLFRSETLQNETLFIGRTNALDSLQKAYNAFQNNQYAATVIIGERGSGKTSLVHNFINKNKKLAKTTFLSSKENLSEHYELMAFLNDSFDKELTTIEEWIAYFNSGKKRTIVLEDIQYFYFRKVGGFNVLHQLSNLIASTKNSVFWIVTSAKYAFQYLDKSIQISELFAFNIQMLEMDKETMKDALIKRHKISGYNLHFEQPPVAYLSSKFLKSPEEVQQEILREEFFSDINKIAQSNFRIAFMYWIRSTVKVSGSTIYMRSLKTIDTSFLNKLSPIKLLFLNSILLQERLSLEDLIELSSLNEQQTKNIVHALFENGLLTMDNEKFYTINIFLYRQITSLLKSKNVIH